MYNLEKEYIYSHIFLFSNSNMKEDLSNMFHV